jgi:hypothetical protein
MIPTKTKTADRLMKENSIICLKNLVFIGILERLNRYINRDFLIIKDLHAIRRFRDRLKRVVGSEKFA